MLRLIRSILFFAFFIARAAADAQSRRAGGNAKYQSLAPTFATAVVVPQTVYARAEVMA
jgi:hypothetical protein